MRLRFHFGRCWFVLLVIITMLALITDCLADEPSSSTARELAGHARLRLRAHRRRHRHRGVDVVEHHIAEDIQMAKDRRKKSGAAASKRERNEALCETERRTRDLNTDDFEYDPPFVQETRCRNTANFELGLVEKLQEQSCVHGLLRCVQRYGEVHVTRRTLGSGHWMPYTLREVAIGCECMWPADKYGHLEL